jgi:hypothetical protein
MSTPSTDDQIGFESRPGLKEVVLADDRMEVVPSNLQILNPSEEGKCRFLYFIWIMPPERAGEPGMLDECAEGRGLCRPFGWFTDHEDLYLLGRHDVPMRRERYKLEKEDYLSMAQALAEAVDRELPKGTWWTYAWMRCDSFGGETPVGTAAHAIEAKGGSRE